RWQAAPRDARTAVRENGDQELSERQAHSGDRLCRDPLAAAGKTEPVGRRRLDAHSVGGDAEDRGHPLDHRRAMRTDLRTLANDRHIDRGDRAAARTNEVGRMPEELVRGGTPPTRTARREVHADAT